MSTKTPLHDQLQNIDTPLLTDDEYAEVGRVASVILLKASKGLASPGPDFERIYGKGYVNGFTAALAEYPALAREVIARSTN